MWKRWSKFILLGVVVVCSLPIVFGTIDYELISRQRRPLFTGYFDWISDGGTYIGWGLGYGVYFNHGCSYSVRHGKSWSESDWAEGPEIVYWFFPYTLFNRSNVTVMERKME